MTALLLQARRHSLGAFEVGRVLPQAARRMVGPFIFYDHLGPVELPRGLAREADVRPHPHIGLSTVTYLFAGEIVHRDSTGVRQVIRPGEVNWMTAGRGVTHSERFEQARREGGPMHAIQAWVALPKEHEEEAPTFAHHAGEALPLEQGGGVWLRLLAGAAYGRRAAVRTHSPLFYGHAVLEAGAELPWPREYPERAAYVVAGRIASAAGLEIPAHEMLVEDAGAGALRAVLPSVVMVLGGEPVGPRFIEWNFVSSSTARIEQAKADWRAGRMALPAGDDQEFIPLPAEGHPRPEPMS